MDATGTLRKTPIIVGLILSVVFQFLLFIAISFLHITYVDKVFYSRFIFWAEVVLLMLYAYKVERQHFLLWDNKSTDLGFFIVSVIVLYLLSWVSIFVSAMPRLFGYHESSKTTKVIALLFVHRPWLMFFTVLTAGITEELIFRAYILTRLSQLIKNPYVPVIISAVLFSALHYGYKSLGEFLFVFLIGVIFGAYYQKYRNIQVLIVVHFMIDLINMTITMNYYKTMK